MPAALDVNWDELRMLSCDLGMKATSERTGISYDAIRQRASREGWFESIPRNQPMPPTKLQPVTFVTSPALVKAQSMMEDALEGRAAALTATRKALVHMAQQTPETLCDKDVAQTLHVHVKSASVAGGYAANSRPDAPAKAFGGRETGLIVDAEVVQITDTSDVPRDENGQISTNVEDY